MCNRHSDLTGTLTGYVGLSDGGDVYELGNLIDGTVVTLSLSQPSTSGLSGVMAILDASGNAVATSNAGATTFSYTIPPTSAACLSILMKCPIVSSDGNALVSCAFSALSGRDAVDCVRNGSVTADAIRCFVRLK